MDLMNRVFPPYLDRFVILFIDDILVTGPDPDTPQRFPGWSRLVESHCTISKECTKGPHLKEK